MKRSMLFLVCLVAGSGAAWAGAAFQTFEGDTTNAPVFDRPIGIGPAAWGPTHYHVQPFHLPAAASCVITSAQSFDGWIHLYQGAFDPEQPIDNLIDGNDDGELGDGTSRIPTTGGKPLDAGDYFLVTSGDQTADFGPFQHSIRCSGEVQPLHGSCPAYFEQLPIEQQACLNGRFTVAIAWATETDSGFATPVRSGSSDSALFWFFNPKNWEVMVKVLDACTLNDRFWVFAGALTNVEYSIAVVDGETLQINAYSNELGTAAPATTDTDAFECQSDPSGLAPSQSPGQWTVRRVDNTL